MKAKFSKSAIAVMCVSMLGTLTFFGCQDKQPVNPGSPITVTTTTDAVVSEEDFNETLLQALEAVDEKSYCKVSKVEGGYDITVTPGSSTQERAVRTGGGVSFVKCVKGYVDGGIAVTVVHCTPGPYCGNIP